MSVVVRISSTFTIVLCKGSSAALETQTGESRGGEGAAGGLRQGQEPLSSAHTSACCFQEVPLELDELPGQKLSPAGTCPLPGGFLTLGPSWWLKGVSEDAVRRILAGKPFELLSESQRHRPCLLPGWDHVEPSWGGWSQLILNHIGLGIR